MLKMTQITRTDAEALATLIRRLRPDWGQSGCVEAIRRCSTGALSEIAVAFIRMAEDGSIHTPGLLHTPGRWWYRAAPGDQPAGEALRNHDHCPVHPAHDRRTCQPCETDRGPDITPEHLAELRHQILEATAAGKAHIQQLAARRRPT